MLRLCVDFNADWQLPSIRKWEQPHKRIRLALVISAFNLMNRGLQSELNLPKEFPSLGLCRTWKKNTDKRISNTNKDQIVG